jgi:PilZ domain
MFQEQRKNRRIERDVGAALVSLTSMLIIECVLKDISATGARISVAVPEVVPDYFKLTIEGQGEQLLPKCRVRWRSGNEFGVEFFRRL